MTSYKTGKANLVAVAWRLGLYAILAFSPFIVEGLVEEEEAQEPFFAAAGSAAGLLGLSTLALQFVLSARLRWAERPFGLDRVMRFHKWMGVTAGLLIIAHPMGYVLAGAGWGLIFSMSLPWGLMVAKAAVGLLVVMVVASIYRSALRIEFEKWRMGHDAGAVVILVLALAHGWAVGGEMERPQQRALFGALTAAALAGLVYVRVAGPLWRKRRAYEVRSVRQETPNVWTVEFAPGGGRGRFEFLPGQFQFVTLYRGAGLPVEEHPFTISSSPTQAGTHTSTIKASGDFTATAGQTKAGDRAGIEGPFGRFSYVLNPEEKDLVFIAGGIGITPLMSMLRHMRDTGWDGKVELLYGNRTQEDIAFGEELGAMEAGGSPRIEVVHVLSDAKEAWQGERGYIDGEKIKRLCGDMTGKAFYLCGPPVMMKKVRGALKSMGAPRGRVHWELFSL